MQLLEFIKANSERFKAIHPIRKLALLVLILFIAGYLLWCRFGKQPPKPDVYVPAAVSHEVASIPKVPITPKVVMVYPAKATEKLGVTTKPNEAVQVAVDIPRLKNGGKAVTFLNSSSGESRTEIKANSTPWFAFERGNAAGIKAELSTQSTPVYSGYYRRDILQSKGVYVVGNLEGAFKPMEPDSSRKFEIKTGISAEYRW